MAKKIKTKCIDEIENRVREILNATDRMVHYHIEIDGESGEFTTIRYSIEEVIVHS